MPRVPPKRKRAAGSAAVVGSEPTPSSSDDTTFIISVLTEWNAIAKDTARSQELLTALVANQCLTPGVNDHADAYWLLLATQTINRLVQYIRTHANTGGADEQEQYHHLNAVAVVLAHLCHSVATSVMVDKSKLDRLTLKQIRNLVGRALVSLTIGSLTAMAYTTGKALWASVVALETMVFHQTIKTTPSLDGWHLALQALNTYLDDNGDLTSECEAAAKLVPFSIEERACLMALLNEPSPTPTKRNRRSTSTASPATTTPEGDAEASQLQVVFRKLELIPLESRVIMKRISSAALVWLVNGQEAILQFCLRVLQTGVEGIPPQQIGTPSKKKTKPKRAACLSIPNDVAKVKLVCRLVAIIAEAVTNGGSRLPAGGMDWYVQTSLTKNKVVKAPDVRDLTVVTMYALVQAHADSLATLKPLTLVNDDKTTAIVASSSGSVALFCPVVHKSLEALCRADCASTRRFLAIVSCHILQSNVFDAKLCSFAVAQFHNCFSFLLDDREMASSDSVNSYKNLQSLPSPSLPKPAKKSSKKATECTFAGLLENSNHQSIDRVLLPLYFRALGSPEAIFSLILDMLEACYDTSSSSDGLQVLTNNASIPKPNKDTKRKRAVRSGKLSQPAVRLNAIRSGLASDACNVFRCLTTTQHSLQAYFRSCLSVDQLGRFVKLAGVLEMILTTSFSDVTTRDAPTSFFHPSANHYSLYERTLWSSHINLCYTLGRGTLLVTSAKNDRVSPILGDSGVRLTVFQQIRKTCGTTGWPLHLPASFHALLSTNLTSEPLVPGQHEPEEFIVSSLIGSIAEALEDPSIVTHAKYLGNDDNDMERTTDERVPLSFRDGRLFLVAISRLPGKDQIKYLSALAKVLLQSLDNYRSDDSLRKIVVEYGEVSQFVARVITVYATLVNLVSADLSDALAEEVGNYQYSLPPLFTLGNILSGVPTKDGNWYKKDCCFMGLFSDWESPSLPPANATMSLPHDVLQTTDNILEHALHLGFQCARRDYGQLLFAAWNASGRKFSWDPRGLKDQSIKPYCSHKSMAAFLLELRDDVCKVFLQTHNKGVVPPNSLLGQTMRNSPIERKIPIQETLNTMLTKAVAAVDCLLERADQKFDEIELSIFEALPVYIAFIMAMHTTSSDTMFSRVAGKKKEKGAGKRQKMTSTKGACYDIELLASIMSDEDSDGSDDEYNYPDATEDMRFDGLAQLHDACNLFGAAPIHPDWLDSTCTFRRGIQNTAAGPNAAKAIECLTKLGTFANDLHLKAMRNRMAVLVKDNPGRFICDSAANLCYLAMDNSNAILSSDSICCVENEFQEAVAAVFEIPLTAIHDFYNDSASTGWRAAKEAWIPNCPQQISGVIHSHSIDGVEASSGEYRAGGDWEILLSEALAGACTGCGMDDSDNSSWNSFDVAADKSSSNVRHVFDAFVLEERWLRISHGVVSQLMPTAALLRFCEAGGDGRSSHQLSTCAQTVDLSLINSSPKEAAEFSRASSSWSEPFRLALLECLSFLVRRSARCHGNHIAKRSCFAVASNLLVEAQPFQDIEGMEAIAMTFDAIDAIQTNLVISPPLDDSRVASFQGLFNTLVKKLQTRGKSIHLSKSIGKESNAPRIFTYLCEGTIFEASVLGIARYEKALCFGNEIADRESAIRSLVLILCSDNACVDEGSRAAIVVILVEVIELEVGIDFSKTDSHIVRRAVLKAMSSLADGPLEKLVEMAFPEKKETADCNLLASQMAIGVAKILAFPLTADKGGNTLTFCLTVFLILQKRLATVETHPDSSESSLGLLFLYGCRVGSLDAVGSSLVDRLLIDRLHEPALIHLENLLFFVQGIQGNRPGNTVSRDRPEAKPKTTPTHERRVAKSASVPDRKTTRACSHILRNGFFHQHWYNCYTCGLVFDKGCCTICALVCHKGHEVAYSRSSSFFCDCGAEAASAGEQNRAVCKCVSLISEEAAEQIWSDERAKNYLAPISETPLSEKGTTDSKMCKKDRSRQVDLFINLAVEFNKETSLAVDQIKSKASQDSWLLSAFGLINHQPLDVESSGWVLGNGIDPSSSTITRESIVATMVRRSGIPLEFDRREFHDLVLQRVSRPGSFNVKLSLDTTTDRVKRTSLARHGIVRSVVAADCRGRLIIAEPSSLAFCAIVPSINTRYVDDPLSTQIGRAQIGVISSHPLSFNAVGIHMCRDNERHVVVWGTSEACVVVLTKIGCGVERTINLDIDLDPQECDSDYLVRCDWVPGSQVHVSVTSGTFVKIYNIASAECDEIIVPQLSYNVAYEAVIKDISWVLHPYLSKDKKGESGTTKVILFLLMDTGRLHETRLNLDGHGTFEVQGSSFLERSSHSVDIPSAGVRPYEGESVGKSGSTTKSMGEGRSLCFLPVSNMLLYQCMSSCVVALPLNEKGEISGSFELLPNRLDSEGFGDGTDSLSVTGPYTHWNEIGFVDGGIRLVCVGKSSRNNQPKLLSVIVKEKSVKVKEIVCSVGGSAGLGLSLSSSFEGLAVFSGPSLLTDLQFDERLYFCVVTSNGSLLVYGEAGSKSLHAGGDSGAFAQKEQDGVKDMPRVALTVYEDLINVSDVNELNFYGDGIGSDADSLKEKLSSKNGIYLMSPSRDGCTVYVALEGPVDMSKLGDRENPGSPIGTASVNKSEENREDLVIVALRFLVGSTATDCVPSLIFVQGRPVELTRDVKRWYDVPLTYEELLMTVRTGFVSIGLGQAFETGHNPLVDAIEVYAIEKKKIRRLIPRSLEWGQRSEQEQGDIEGSASTRVLVLQTRIISLVYQLVGGSLDQATPEGKSLKHLVRRTALSEDKFLRDNVCELLERVERNPDTRQKFLDEAIVLGIGAALQVACNTLRQASAADHDGRHLGRILKSLLDTSLQSAISIALSRPENYVRAAEKLSSEGLSPFSIAITASDILVHLMMAGIAHQDIIENVVHILLAELSIGTSRTASANCAFASFAVITKLFKLDNQEFVEHCCAAVRSFIDTYSHSMKKQLGALMKTPDADVSAPIAYQCDSCSKFPITDARYTLLEGDHDIDLCTKCYQLGSSYAENPDFNPDSPVIIKGRSIGGGVKLSCGQIKQMESVRIDNGTDIVEQVEQAMQEATSGGRRSCDPDNKLRRAIQSNKPELVTNAERTDINFDVFTDDLFDNIIGFVGYLHEGCSVGVPMARLSPLLTLVLDSISMGANENAHIARGKRFVREVLKQIYRLIEAMRSGSRSDKACFVLLINFLRSLARLTGAHSDDGSSVGNSISEPGGQSTDDAKRKTDPRFMCDVHNVPAVRRRCSSGGNKHKRFYVCGMDRKERCKYFKWACESNSQIAEGVGQQSRFEMELELFIWQLLTDSSQNQAPTLSDQLCDLMETEFSRFDVGKTPELHQSDRKSSGDQLPSSKKNACVSLYDKETAVQDFEDGVFCAKEKLWGVAPVWMCKQDYMALPRELLLSEDNPDDQKLSDKCIEASLDLVSTVASASSSRELQMPGHKRWFSLLCEVISASPFSRFRSQAEKALKRMCGGNRALYHCVGDYYVFGFQFREILYHSKSTLDGALTVRNMARQCGERWNDEKISWQGMKAGELLGTLDLVPEDCLTSANSKRIGAILDEILSVAKSRVDNWRNFCSLLSLPVGDRQRPDVSPFGKESLLIERTFGGPLILSFFWLCCSLSGPNQVKLMKLLDLALTSAQDRRCQSTAGKSEVFGDNIEGVVSDAMEVDVDDVSLSFSFAPQAFPEETLLKGLHALSLEDLFAFANQFVLRGRSADLRRIACQVTSKLCRHLDANSLFNIVNLFVDKPLAEIESLGCNSVQYLQLLDAIIKVGDWNGSQDLAHVGRQISNGFTKQMNVYRWIGGKVTFPGDPERNVSKRFDLSSCVHCHRLHLPSHKNANGKAGHGSHDKKHQSDLHRVKGTEKILTDACKSTVTLWHPEQIRPFVRGRLENSTDNTCSSEFAVYVQLKTRLAISEIYATINDPRGRYVKTINVSFTPRQVADVNELKSTNYDYLWQDCATLNLTRGATQASAILPITVIAANLKFEYRDFYDRTGGSRSVDGSLILVCPRCSRPVNNAHGVCSSCGECLFQCRRCRHIQYDRPDAFFCAECGHCSSGSFSYELKSGVASSAVAIVDDESYGRMVKMTQVATKLHGDLQTALIDMLRAVSRKRATPEVDHLAEYSPALKRALKGDLPTLDDHDKKGGASANENRDSVTSVRDSDGRSTSNAAYRARSLLRLARQLRGEGEQSERRRELLVREAFLGASEFSLEEVDDDGADIVGLFNSDDRRNTLTRLVASLTGRRNALRSHEAEITDTSTVAASKSSTAVVLTKKDSAKCVKQECEKLYHLMREAELECYEFRRRLDAWNRLESDSLKETTFESNLSFTPTKCSHCTGPVILHLLLPLLRLVRSEKIGEIESVVTGNFVRALFLQPDSVGKDLDMLKRLTITTLCLKSEYAAKIILNELRSRLRASQDENSASILGKLLEYDFSLSSQFLALATETLDSSFMI